MALGIGMCVNQSKAVIEALVGYETAFNRTPKTGMRGPRPELAEEEVPHAADRAAASGAGPGGYLTSAIWFALDKGVYFSLPFLLLFQWASSTWGWSRCCRARLGALMRWIRGPAEDAARRWSRREGDGAVRGFGTRLRLSPTGSPSRWCRSAGCRCSATTSRC